MQTLFNFVTIVGAVTLLGLLLLFMNAGYVSGHDLQPYVRIGLLIGVCYAGIVWCK